MKKEPVWKTFLTNIIFYFRYGYFPYDYPYEKDCPSCHKKINYMCTGGMSQAFPHFYCTKCSNVLHRESDFVKVMKNEVLEKLLLEIKDTLPECRCGGKFSVYATPKCPYCRYEFKDNTDPVRHLTNPFLVKIKGAKIYRK